MGFNRWGNADELYDAVKAQYPSIVNNDTEIRTEAAVEFLTDFAFAYPADFEAFHHLRYY